MPVAAGTARSIVLMRFGVLGPSPGRVLALVLGAALGAAVLAGCGGADGASSGVQTSSSPSTPTGSVSPTTASGSTTGSTPPTTTSPTTTAPPPNAEGHAVAAPGRLTDGVVPADLLVVGSDTLPPSVVRRVRQLPGVASVERISLAQVSVQDRLLGVAAVDPATYRRYTKPVSAFSLPVWRRVAAGDLAVVRNQSRRLRSVAAAVPLGSAATAPRIRLGAIAPQIPQIEAVVNRTWIRPLGMRPGNALIISTGIDAPAGVRGPVQRVVGRSVSVQRLDVAARLGLDPAAQQTAVVVGTTADAVGVYRYSLSGGRVVPDPAWVAAHITTEAVPILGDVTCNRLMFPQLRAALDQVVTAGLADAIHASQYGGCYNARFIAGTTTLSNHAFGLAIDLNVPENERGTVGQINRQVVAIFQSLGFTWGGTWSYTDPMHFELNSLVDPG